MRNVLCTWEEHDDTGIQGLVPIIHRTWFDKGYYIPGQLGHELIEHSSNEKGKMEDELAAFGGILFVREFNQLTEYTNIHSPEANLAADFFNSFRDSDWEWVDRCERKYSLRRELREKVEDFIRDCVWSELEKLVMREYSWEVEWELACIHKFKALDIPNVISWVQYGYSRARKRYKGRSWEAWAMLQEINRVVRGLEKRLEYEPYVGERFMLSYGIKDCVCKVRRLDDEYGY